MGRVPSLCTDDGAIPKVLVRGEMLSVAGAGQWKLSSGSRGDGLDRDINCRLDSEDIRESQKGSEKKRSEKKLQVRQSGKQET